MGKLLETIVGKTVQRIMQRLNGRGQSLPGLIIEKLQPNYLASMLQQLPEGIVFVMGTNGKTTTTKIVVELLQAAGKRVITNATGSNLTRGVISGVLQHASWRGALPFDIGVFEVDEAYAKKLVTQIQPKWVLALNVSRDQLDRFGEVDAVADLLHSTMSTATEGVITNADDPYLSAIGEQLSAQHLHTDYFSVHRLLHQHFPHEKTNEGKKTQRAAPRVELTHFYKQHVTYTIDGTQYQTRLNLVDAHNYLNAAAALTLVMRLLPDLTAETHVANLSKITPAYGRGEVFVLKNGGTVQLTLVKNPASFFQALMSHRPNDCHVMIAINDNYADSRDVSWLWDVDFLPLKGEHIVTTGRRAADMALRLQYDDIPTTDSISDIDQALQTFCRSPKRKVIFATYTAMLHLYEVLKKRAAEPSQPSHVQLKPGVQQIHEGTQ